MYKYLLDKDKNLFYPLIDDKSIVNVNTINDVQIEELFNPTVEDFLVEEEYQFVVGQYPSASIGVEYIPERASKLAYLDVITSNPECCHVSSVDKTIITLGVMSRGESTITITEANSGISKDVKVVVQAIPQLYTNGVNGGWVETWAIKESAEQSTFHVEARPYSSKYQFDHWSDGSTENPREITIYEDTELTAFFEPIYYNVEVRSSNEEYGTVSGGGQFMYDSYITISASPNFGYRFVLWSDGDTNPERLIWVYGDVVYEAIFEEINPNLVIYYTSNDGLGVWPHSYDFGANLVENIYTNGQGMMVFDGDVSSIGSNAFYGCSSLTSITIPESVTSIGDYAFDECASLTSITIPESVTSLGWCVFRDCFSLTSINIPENITSIGRDTFENCTSLTSITLPKDLVNLSSESFRGCDALHTIIWNATHCNNIGSPSNMQGYLINTDTAKHITTFIIGNSVEVLPYLICSKMSIKNIVIPNSVLIIENNAFYYCSSLTSIVIPESVTSIGEKAFTFCDALTSIVVAEGNTVYDSRENCNAIIETAMNTLICGCQNTIIPESVTSIGSYAFYGCSSLTSITIPESVTSIGERAFYGCSSLTSITIPNSVTSIGHYAFYGCSSLKTITCEAITPPTLGSGNNLSKVTAVYVPAGSVDAYKNATNWSYYANVIQPIPS